MTFLDKYHKSEFFSVNDNFIEIIMRYAKGIEKQITITPSSHGKSSFVYFVQDDTGEFIYKFPRTLFSNKTIYKEKFVTDNLRCFLTFQVPDIYIENHFGRSFTRYKIIEGENMSDVILNDIETRLLIKDLVKIMVAFHAIPVESISYDIGTKRESLELFCKDFDYSPPFDEISDLLNEKTLIHGDYHRSNIILKDKRVNGVLDFATVSVGSIYFDIGQMMFSMNDNFNSIFIEEYENSVGQPVDVNKICRIVSFLDNMINKNYLPFIRNKQNV